MIYICCPAYTATGGTELLHQLFFALRKQTRQVRMFYLGVQDGVHPVAPRFEKYDVELACQIEDSVAHCIVMPEVGCAYLRQYTKTKKMIWWLSVDNFYRSNGIAYPYKIWNIRSIVRLISRFRWLNNPSITHLAQSHYAKKHLKKYGLVAEMLSDYLGSDFIAAANNLSSEKKDDVVLYNPLKGVDYTKSLIEAAPSIRFVPLQGMTPQQVVETCKKSKVYIDFGNHPGKDRFPREASVLGCVIVTGMRGSARNDEDIKIPWQYKFHDRKRSIPLIIKQIQNIFGNFEAAQSDFVEYRNRIMAEESVFLNEINAIWNRIWVHYGQ